jgi:hypothetical protein
MLRMMVASSQVVHPTCRARAVTGLRTVSTGCNIPPPGLLYVESFINSDEREDMINYALILREKIRTDAHQRAFTKGRTYLSKQHNLKSEESYRIVTLPNEADEGRRPVIAQYFDKYGEDGHELTYFINNSNIPDFVKHKLIFPLSSASKEIQELMKLKKSQGQGHLKWNFTCNFYGLHGADGQLAGFPFHVDVPSNGDITCIHTILTAATLQIRKKADHSQYYSVVMRPGSILLLSGESRWDWEHRVLPQSIDLTTLPAKLQDIKVGRISLVLGCN